jgi:imidazole glycerol-phosphate synthase subunit HisH
MTSSVAVVDYGAGNILNVLRAFASQGINTDLVSDPARLRHYSHVVLPGVGAFDYGMDNLTKLKLGDEIVALVADARPVLGICLGMQLLAERGYENGLTAGLGLISGDIVHLNKLQGADGAARVPHTGWSSVIWREGQDEPLGLLSTAYFNHSFYLENPQDREVVATTAFGEIQIPVAIRAGSLFATQFHPEKSGQAGLGLLRAWLHSDLSQF